MCGIIGIFGDNNPEKRAHDALEKITHRGSSTHEVKCLPHAVLGANRLPIVARALGRQPQVNEDCTIFVVQNGEIFNYQKLQDELKDKGHTFRTNSDTEVLTHLYEEYGAQMVTHLDSEMFALVVYNSVTKDIFAARDALGVKPLYHAIDSTGQFYFASEMKQLACFKDIKKIYEFPPGHYYLNGQMTEYFALKYTNTLRDEQAVVKLLEDALIQAVKKRVQTDLPLGVLLSGGVDSSLVMEIASRYHSDITAIILGYPESLDYQFALRLCQERGYKYHIVSPDVDYAAELDNVIYQLETYEPQIIRQSFALDLCAKVAHQLGLRVVLVGDGSDELFAGYNEFSKLPKNLVNEGCFMLLKSLHNGHLQRLDRMSMKYTVEVRSPFFDQQVVDLALQIDGGLKIINNNLKPITKYILRKVAANFLPDYIAWRDKAPFANGAGMNVGTDFRVEEGDVAKVAAKRTSGLLTKELLQQYDIKTKEGEYCLEKFIEYGYAKLANATNRLIVKDNLDELTRPKKDCIFRDSDLVIKAMTLNKYRRALPFLKDVLRSYIEKAIKLGKPISCFGFWGASLKRHVDETDRAMLLSLSNYFDSISKIYPPGITMTFVLSDEHAESNGYAHQNYDVYLDEIEALLKMHGFLIIRLSTLWKKWGINHELVQELLNRKQSGWWNEVTIAKQLEIQAAKRSTDIDVVKGAQRYFVMRMLERPYLENIFSGSIHIAFADPQQQLLFPLLPTVYIFTTKKGTSRVSWFENLN